MSDNKKFETQVQQKLQELDFSPSASVWDRIEAQLPPESKRRVIPFFWRTFMVAAAAAAGGYFFFVNKNDNYKDNSTLNATVPVISQNSIGGEKQNPKVGVPAGSPDRGPGVAQSEQASSSVGSAESPDGRLSPYKNRRVSRDKPGASNLSRHLSRHSGGNLRSSDIRKLNTSGFLLKDEEERPENIASGFNTREVSPVIIDGNISYSLDFKVEASIKPMDALKKTPVKPKTNKKWSFELSFSAGQSIYSDGKVEKLFTGVQPPVLNQAMPPGYNLYLAPPTPSEVKPGTSFSAGANVRYRISRKLSVTAGLTYSLLTTKIATGDRYPSPTMVSINGRSQQVSGYYDPGYMNEYTNKYHFIEIPVLVHYQLNKGDKLPLFVHGGVSLARLLKTNTLHFDRTANIYYKANELVKRNFVNIEGGVSAKLFASRKFPVTIGPEIQYGITNLFAGKVQQNDKHSLFLGLKASVPLSL